MKNKLKHIDAHILVLLLMMFIVLALMAAIKGETYFTLSNLSSMIFQFPEYGILAFGMMICMLAGGIDLSLVGIMNLSGVVAALIIKNGGGIPVACLAAIAVAASCGALNGIIIASLNIPPMLVTLCGLELYPSWRCGCSECPGSWD